MTNILSYVTDMQISNPAFVTSVYTCTHITLSKTAFLRVSKNYQSSVENAFKLLCPSKLGKYLLFKCKNLRFHVMKIKYQKISQM